MSREMDAYPIKSQNTAHRVLGDEAIIADFRDSFFYNLNPVGTFIWARCDGRHSLAEIAKAVMAEFQVDLEIAARDCREFVDELAEQGLLILRSGPEAGED
jgi:hypothetical protein